MDATNESVATAATRDRETDISMAMISRKARDTKDWRELSNTCLGVRVTQVGGGKRGISAIQVGNRSFIYTSSKDLSAIDTTYSTMASLHIFRTISAHHLRHSTWALGV